MDPTVLSDKSTDHLSEVCNATTCFRPYSARSKRRLPKFSMAIIIIYLFIIAFYGYYYYLFIYLLLFSMAMSIAHTKSTGKELIKYN